MAIHCRAEPRAVRTRAHAALACKLHHADSIPSLRGAPHTGRPLPVYNLTARAALGAKPLLRARRTGWRYPILGGDECGLVLISETHGEPSYAGISGGEFPRRALEALLLAEKLLKKDKKYEARFLDVPELKLYALWFHAARDNKLITLAAGIERPDLGIEPNITAAARRCAAALKTPRFRMPRKRS